MKWPATAVMMAVAWVPGAFSAVAPAPSPAAGRKLYLAKCASCHKLYEPARYDDAKWSQWMDKMRKKAKLNDDQYRQLAAYTETLRTPRK